MALSNIHNQRFEEVSESCQELDSIRTRLIEGMLELSEAKRIYSSKQKESVEKEVELDKLVESNQALKLSLMKSLVEKEKLMAKKTFLVNTVHDFNQQIDALERDSPLKLYGERVKSFCERNSTANQRNIINKIVDAKSKLLEYGLSNYSSE